MTVEVILGIVVLCLSLENVFQKMYNCNTNPQRIGIYGFNLISIVAGLIIFLLMPKSEKELPFDIYFYAGAFAVAFLSARYFKLRAIGEGSLSLTSLITSYSLLIPTFYGVFFLKESLTTLNIAGMILLFISLYFVSEAKGSGAISGKWIVFIGIAFVGNGMCSTIQKLYQLKSGGEFKAEFMIIALIIIAVALLILTVFKEKSIPVPKPKNGSGLAICLGVANAVVNMLVMMLAKYPAAIVFPTIQGGSIVIIYLISKFCFKEKLSINQNVGFCLGVFSIVFLNM